MWGSASWNTDCYRDGSGGIAGRGSLCEVTVDGLSSSGTEKRFHDARSRDNYHSVRAVSMCSLPKTFQISSGGSLKRFLYRFDENNRSNRVSASQRDVP